MCRWETVLLHGMTTKAITELLVGMKLPASLEKRTWRRRRNCGCE